MKQEAKYVLGIWLTSVIVGSTLFYWGSYFINYDVITHGGKAGDRIAMYLMTLVFSLVLSIPALILLGLSTYVVLETRLAFKIIRWLLSFVCVVLCTLTFGMLSEFNFGVKDLTIIGCYSVPLVAGAFLYKLR
ncbi:MAG: hypothetical protein EOO90_05275 [Pedobacter sp.]|nr:MAG: hypothetical protein EOO90_05275 [Pedobacter sp.]